MKYKLKFLVTIVFLLFVGSLVTVSAEDCDVCNTGINEEENTEKETTDEEDDKIDRDALLKELEKIKEKISYLKWRLEGVRLKKKLNSGAYIVLDINDREVLIKESENKVVPIASITKLMSSLVAKGSKDIEEEVVLTREMLSTIYNKTDALFPNLVISIKNLLSASLISSINDASQCLNYVVREDLIPVMNKTAQALDMKQTSFVDAHGIGKDNISSANDIARFLYYIYLNHSDLLELTTNDDFWLPDRNNNLIKFKNNNLFHEVPEFVGGKTGFTDAARNTFAGVFEFDEDPYIIVLLYSYTRTNDTNLIIDWIRRKPPVAVDKS